MLLATWKSGEIPISIQRIVQSIYIGGTNYVYYWNAMLLAVGTKSTSIILNRCWLKCHDFGIWRYRTEQLLKRTNMYTCVRSNKHGIMKNQKSARASPLGSGSIHCASGLYLIYISFLLRRLKYELASFPFSSPISVYYVMSVFEFLSAELYRKIVAAFDSFIH